MPEDSPGDRELDAATERLAMECDVSKKRQAKHLRAAIAQYARKERMSADEAATAMLDAWREWREYCEETPNLRFRWGPVKFFTEGHWRNPGGWPREDPRELERMRLERELRTGMVQ